MGQPCGGSGWGHVVLPDTLSHGGSAPILSDIQNCTLQDISWVIPDEKWSGSMAAMRTARRLLTVRSWVANIIDAVGNSWSDSAGGGKCDYWGTYWTEPGTNRDLRRVGRLGRLVRSRFAARGVPERRSNDLSH